MFPVLVDGFEREDATAVRLAVGMLGLLVVFLGTVGATEMRQSPRLRDVDLEILPTVPACITGLSLAQVQSPYPRCCEQAFATCPSSGV